MLKEFPLGWAKESAHFFLIRHPARVICSYIKGRAAFDIDDLGYRPQRQLFDRLSDLTGTAPPIVDCDDILRAPEMTLANLCRAIGLPWDRAMLSWEAGPRDTDGAWAPYWYSSVERSTGFSAPPKELPTVPPEFSEIYRVCMRDYEVLASRRLTT